MPNLSSFPDAKAGSSSVPMFLNKEETSIQYIMECVLERE